MNRIYDIFNNFNKFYNEINGATLTGAIDVVVVEQEDGSHSCSPFHVRFGKIGVLRSREKVVDIEVNGGAVDIHMKLGESGEAFFVEEIDDDDEAELPANLATSPIPTSQFLYDDDSVKFSPIEPTLMDEYSHPNHLPRPRRNSIDLADNLTMIGVGMMSGQESLDDAEPKKFENEVSDFSRRRYTDTIQRKDLINTNKEFTTRKLREEWAEHEQLLRQKNEDGNTLATATVGVGDKPDNETVAEEPAVIATVTKEDDGLVKEESKSKKKRRKKSIMKKKNSQRKNSSSSSNGSMHSEPQNQENDTADSLSSSQQTIANGSSSTDNNTPTQVAKETAVVDVERASIEEEPLKPLIAAVGPSPSDSARIRNLDMHCFSDTEVNDSLSRSNSRPPTPIQSDTEFEVNQRQATCPGVISHSASWNWGELPTKETVVDTAAAKQSQRNSMLSGMFSFMRQNNKRRKDGAPEGLYLADLDAEGMDPEVAALYFPQQNDSGKTNDQTHTDDDRESGNGTSLAHSPSSIDLGSKGVDSDFDEGGAKDKFLDFIAISTCGGLDKPGGPTREQFDSQLVTYSEVCQNPSLFSSPNLVVRLNNKLYSWSAACPIVMTMFAFSKPLPDDTIDQLMGTVSLEKAPASIQSEGRGFPWFNWRKSTDKNSPDAQPSIKSMTDLKDGTGDQTTMTQKVVQTQLPLDKDASEQTNEPDVAIGTDTKEPTPNEDLSNISLDSSALELAAAIGQKPLEGKPPSKEKYKKTLRLSSEQIAALNLKSGINEVEFSVTTAYQGTSRAKCYIFLWKYNDKVVISDVDGTITKSDVLGHLMPLVGRDWAQMGVAKLYSKIEDNGYKMLYLSARAIGQSRATRDYLRSIRQGDVNLPDGPLLLNPTSLLSAFHREVIEKKPELFKIACLNDIKALFPTNPFYAGYGNRINDTWAYRAVGIPIERIFTINTKGELRHELTKTFQSSYADQSMEVNMIFPRIECRRLETSDYNDEDYDGEYASSSEDGIEAAGSDSQELDFNEVTFNEAPLKKHLAATANV